MMMSISSLTLIISTGLDISLFLFLWCIDPEIPHNYTDGTMQPGSLNDPPSPRLLPTALGFVSDDSWESPTGLDFIWKNVLESVEALYATPALAASGV